MNEVVDSRKKQLQQKKITYSFSRSVGAGAEVSLIDLAAMFYSMKTQWLKIFCITFVVCCCAVFYLAHNKGNKFLLTFDLPYTVDQTGAILPLVTKDSVLLGWESGAKSGLNNWASKNKLNISVDSLSKSLTVAGSSADAAGYSAVNKMIVAGSVARNFNSTGFRDFKTYFANAEAANFKSELTAAISALTFKKETAALALANTLAQIQNYKKITDTADMVDYIALIKSQYAARSDLRNADFSIKNLHSGFNVADTVIIKTSMIKTYVKGLAISVFLSVLLATMLVGMLRLMQLVSSRHKDGE